MSTGQKRNNRRKLTSTSSTNSFTQSRHLKNQGKSEKPEQLLNEHGFPKLTAEEQVEADVLVEPYVRGTRVFALYGNALYPAVVMEDGIFGLSYNVKFVEGGEERRVSHDGIVSLAFLNVDDIITVFEDLENDVKFVKAVRLTSVPSKEDQNEWFEGICQYEEMDSSGEMHILGHNWSHFQISKDQRKKILDRSKKEKAQAEKKVQAEKKGRGRPKVIKSSPIASPSPYNAYKRTHSDNNEPIALEDKTQTKRTKKVNLKLEELTPQQSDLSQDESDSSGRVPTHSPEPEEERSLQVHETNPQEPNAEQSIEIILPIVESQEETPVESTNDRSTVKQELNMPSSFRRQTDQSMQNSMDDEFDEAKNFCQKLWNYQERGLMDKCTLRVEGKEIKVYKIVLILRSEVFNQLLANSNVIDVKDFHYDAMKSFIEFLHCGSCEKLSEYADELLLIADHYEVDELKSKCVQILGSSITESNFFGRLQSAFKSNIDTLKREVLEFIEKEAPSKLFSKLTATKEWFNFAASNEQLAQEILLTVYNKFGTSY